VHVQGPPGLFVSACPMSYLKEYCGGVRWPAPEKSPDLGNSSPTPRALMYVASLRTLVRYHHHYEDDRNRQMRTGTGRQSPKLGGCGQD
jgi:hypothetical protein